MKIGIFFGGRSREREISFAGGRTVYDNLNKSLFEPIPIFIDSFGNFILLNWQYIYKGSIRDFYPAANAIQEDSLNIQIYAEALGNLDQDAQDALIQPIGRKITLEELPELIDFAFLALHGAYGEDGTLQGLLDYLHIPYSGSGILASSIGMNKVFQKNMVRHEEFGKTRFCNILRQNWLSGDTNSRKALYNDIKEKVGLPLVSRPANQGSSIGVGMLMQDDFEAFSNSIFKALFIERIEADFWGNLNKAQKFDWLKDMCDLRSNIGLPIRVNGTIVYSPKALLHAIETHFVETKGTLYLEALDGENEVLVEEFIEGTEFSCIVVRNEVGEVIALPPTQIIKGQEIYDYRSKYLPGMSRKQTPIDLPNIEWIENIRVACGELFEFFRFEVYARIDGFIWADGSIVLNDPNTTSGMLPSSFFFHQAAEIGLNPSQFLTFLIRQSLQERYQSILTSEKYLPLLQDLDAKIEELKTANRETIKIGVVLGGYSSERHISVESGRNIYEKLASSIKYEPVPIFLTGDAHHYELHQIPINLLLKDNADDIAEKLTHFEKHSVMEAIKKDCQSITDKYSNAETALAFPKKMNLADLKGMVDMVFIALHGRPGEDGALQKDLKQHGIPFNGSPAESAAITIDKFKTNQLLKDAGFPIATQVLVQKNDWKTDENAFYSNIEALYPYPFITKPVDDGCSSAVKLIKNQAQLKAFSQQIFREVPELLEEPAKVLNLKRNEEFPQKTVYLVETFTTAQDAAHFMEVTGGLLTKIEDNVLTYEVFEPSETLTAHEILSLEEKFLAGEGQNLTPARFSPDTTDNAHISKEVRACLLKAAKLLQIEGYARIDAFVRIYEDGKVETIIIEINSLPGMTPATAIFHQAALNGYKPYEFIDAIINFSLQNKSVEQ